MSALPFVAAAASLGGMYVLAARMFASASLGVVAAVIFALTPLLWRQFGDAPASLYPLPFLVGGLGAVAHFEHSRDSRWLAAAGAMLGTGIYTSVAAMVMMPLYLVLTIAVLAYSRTISARQAGLAVAAFVAAASPFAVSLVLHPEDFRNTVNALHLYDANRLNPLQGVRDMASWIGLTARSEVYYDYFNPAFLFITGHVLLWPLAILIPIGFYQIATDETSVLARLAVGGFFIAPFAAALTAENPIPRRILFITPFAVLVATAGMRRLLAWWTSVNSAAGRRRLARP